MGSSVKIRALYITVPSSYIIRQFTGTEVHFPFGGVYN